MIPPFAYICVPAGLVCFTSCCFFMWRIYWEFLLLFSFAGLRYIRTLLASYENGLDDSALRTCAIRECIVHRARGALRMLPIACQAL